MITRQYTTEKKLEELRDKLIKSDEDSPTYELEKSISKLEDFATKLVKENEQYRQLISDLISTLLTIINYD